MFGYDDHDILFTCQFVLESYDYKVDGFIDPKLALKAYNNGLYDLIVLDIRMPIMNGFELYRLLKRRDVEASICFITAGEIKHYEYQNIPDLFDSNRFLRKPFTNAELLGYVARMIKYSQKMIDLCVN